MRDAEFSKVFSQESTALELFFRKKLKNGIAKGDKALQAEDLTQLTGLLALENSRKPKKSHRKIVELLWMKAQNVLYEYCNPPKKQFVTHPIGVVAIRHSNEQSAHTRIELRQNINRIKNASDNKTWLAITQREAGYNDEEISIELNLSKENIRKKISLLRNKITSRYKTPDEL